MYTIANVIYGWDCSCGSDFFEIIKEYSSLHKEYVLLPEDLDQDIDDNLIEEFLMFSKEEDGFLEFYSGAGDVQPLAFGIKVHEFDETENFSLSVLTNLKPNLKEFNRVYSKLPQDLRDLIIAKELKPELTIIWSTS